MSPRRRAALLVVCGLAGAAVGFGGQALTGSQWWFAAIPALVAAAWLGVADPERCVSNGPSRPEGGPHGPLPPGR